MFCSRCGSEVASQSKFCPSCGLDLQATTPIQALATGGVAEFDLVREALGGEYEILEELGRGGMALVFRARDLHLEREVAVKVLPFTLAFDADFVERFQREARTAAQLEHPNIIPIYCVGRSGRVIYFVMKYLRGGSLSSVLHERKTLTPPEIRRLLVEAGSALGYAAQRGIVHRDIKPDNIMFDEFGQSLLTDFGIAKAASGQRLTGTGMSIGTPHYMSPEQARAQTIDGRSDIYSLGVVAYQCLTGSVPYDGEDSFSIGYKHITEPIPTPQLLTADERRLFEVIKRMLMKDPADRYQSCEELVASLQNQPIAAPGAVRASLVAAVSGPKPSIATISSQPTTPINSAGVERRISGGTRRDVPGRRVADRSAVMKQGSGMPAWPFVVLAVIGGGAGALYYYQAHGFSSGSQPVAAVAAESAGTAAPPPGGANPPNASTPPPALPVRHESVGRADSARAAGPPHAATDAGGAARTPPAPTARPRTSADSGGIRVVNLPRGSTVLIDDKPASEPLTRLAPGLHTIGISAPGHNFYVDTINVEPGTTVEIVPELTRLGEPVAAGKAQERRTARPEVANRATPSCTPGPGYSADACFDERPKPVQPPFVPVPPDAVGTPEPSLLWVKVSADGKTLETRSLKPSSDGAFEREVRSFAKEMSWYPATKGGAPVEAWTQMVFRPQP
ncbi:MAG TPA: protein kinase [Gemmatimonadales bacterium]|nr:protein kinase [Gemmatimonadales bacterium]